MIRNPLMRKEKLVEEVCKLITMEETTESGIQLTKKESLELLKKILKNTDLENTIKNIEINRKPVSVYKKTVYKVYSEFLGHRGPIDRIIFDHTSEFLFSASSDGIIKIWNIPRGLLVRSLYGHNTGISDLCISSDGNYLVSSDYLSYIYIWDLRKLQIIHTLKYTSEAVFCEFVFSDFEGSEFTCVLRNGIVKTVRFDSTRIISEKENIFMSGESIKDICITDGGRFLICGGWWSLLLVYDTRDIEKAMVFDNMSLQTICASRNGLRIAASYEDGIVIYTFYPEYALGRYKKKSCFSGSWDRIVHPVATPSPVDRMIILAQYLLVTISLDNMVRIYDDRLLVFEFPGELGSLYAHPSRNMFVLIGTYLCMYEIVDVRASSHEFSENTGLFNDGFGFESFSVFDPIKDMEKARQESFTGNEFHGASSGRILNGWTIQGGYVEGLYIYKFYSEELSARPNDCAFSNDGRFFVVSNDRGTIKTYSVNGNDMSAPKEQFFPTDFKIVTTDFPGVEFDTPNESTKEENFEYTVGIDGTPNKTWEKMEYRITPIIEMYSSEIEKRGMELLEKDKITYKRFSELYLESTQIPEPTTEDPTWNEENETIQMNEESIRSRKKKLLISSESSEYEIESDDMVPPRRILRRDIRERQSTEFAEMPLGRVLRRNLLHDENSSLGLSSFTSQSEENDERKKRKKYIIDTDSEND